MDSSENPLLLNDEGSCSAVKDDKISILRMFHTKCHVVWSRRGTDRRASVVTSMCEVGWVLMKIPRTLSKLHNMLLEQLAPHVCTAPRGLLNTRRAGSLRRHIQGTGI